MGFKNWWYTGAWSTPPASTGVASPWAPPNSLESAIVGEVFGADPGIITRETAMRVPGLKRAIQVHADLVSTMPLVQYRAGEKVDPQPDWLQNSASGIPPLIRTKGLVRDLALEGWALLACDLDGDQISDAVHVPRAMWSIGTNGELNVDARITYRGRFIVISLGSNGILVDGIDTIRQARALDQARTTRLESPPAGTELHVTDKAYDEMTRKEKLKVARDYAEQRRKLSVSVTPSYLEVKEHGSEPVDLFDSATNSIRLDIANHASLPAAVIEGAKATGGGDMSYSNTATERSELWDLGSRQFADAIAARLSLDDVCPSGEYIAFDTSAAFAAPTPTTPPNLED